MMVKVFINEQHTLLPDQEILLNEKFPNNWELCKVPANGWTKQEMHDMFYNRFNELFGGAVVFVSPIPYLIKLVAEASGGGAPTYPWIFHNDKREKKELPNGKIISVVAEEGWELI